MRGFRVKMADGMRPREKRAVLGRMSASVSGTTNASHKEHGVRAALPTSPPPLFRHWDAGRAVPNKCQQQHPWKHFAFRLRLCSSVCTSRGFLTGSKRVTGSRKNKCGWGRGEV